MQCNLTNTVSFSTVICWRLGRTPVPSCWFDKLCGDASWVFELLRAFVSCGLFSFYFSNYTHTHKCAPSHQDARHGNDCPSVLAGGGEPFRVRSVFGNYSAQFRPTSCNSPLLWVLQPENVKYHLPSHLFSPLPFFLPHTRDGGRKSAFLLG